MDEGDRRGVDRLTIQEAARRLGISEGAVRKRVTRRTLKHDKEDDGRVYVYLDAGGRRGVDSGQDKGVDPNSSALISRLESEVAFLRDQVQRQQEIIAQQAVSMRQLTAAASQESPEDAETVEREPEGAEPRSDAPGAQEPVERPQQRSAWGKPVDKLPWWQYLLALGLVAGLAVLITSEFFYARVHAALGASIAIDLAMISLLWASPGIIGFWVGLKHRNLRLWRHLVPIGTTVGATAVVAVVPQSLNDIGVPGSGFAGPGDFALAITVLVFIPALILYMSGAIIGRAFQRRTALTLDTEAIPSAPRLSAPGDGWSPKKQALLGFSGTVVAALISVIGQLVIAGSGGGG